MIHSRDRLGFGMTGQVTCFFVNFTRISIKQLLVRKLLQRVASPSFLAGYHVKIQTSGLENQLVTSFLDFLQGYPLTRQERINRACRTSQRRFLLFALFIVLIFVRNDPWNFLESCVEDKFPSLSCLCFADSYPMSLF